MNRPNPIGVGLQYMCYTLKTWKARYPCDIVNSSKETFIKGVSRMNSISQLMKYRRSMVKYALKHGVTKTAIKYNTYRQYVYRWLRRYDGSLESLRNKPRRPKHHPKAHTDWRKVCAVRMSDCWKRFYQYTAIDEFSRWRYVEAFEEHSTYSSMIFLVHLVQAFPMPIECVQTDNGTEFTKRFTKARLDEDLTFFERKLKELGIKHKKIRPFTPRHNGEVERSHRKDNERFYATHCFFSFEDFRRQLKRYNYRDYNCFPMRPLGWKSPKDTLHDFIKHGVTYVWQTNMGAL